MRRFLMKSVLRLMPLLLAAALLPGCGSGTGEPVSRTAFFFDTVVQIKIYEYSAGWGTNAEDILDGAEKMCRGYESMFSRTAEGSDVWRINNAGGANLEVSDETAALLAAALEYHALSGGVFDVTVGGFSELWDFDGGIMPDEADLLRAREAVGADNILIDGKIVRLANPDTRLDLGGIAKGYIADRLAEYLKDQGVTAAMINLGGNILSVGQRASGQLWTIGIQEPFSEASALAAAVETGETSVVSSGVYQRYFELDGIMYHHILDPATGLPAETGLLSVSIITQSSMAADALSTTVFMLGAEEGMELVETLAGVECVMINNDGELLLSSGVGGEIGFIAY